MEYDSGMLRVTILDGSNFGRSTQCLLLFEKTRYALLHLPSCTQRERAAYKPQPIWN
jgi:hypothetical protein